MARKLVIGMLCLIMGLALLGCAATPVTRNFLTQQPGLYLSEVNAESTRVSELSNTAILGIFFAPRTFPSVAETAQAGNITRIVSVEHFTRIGILGLTVTYYTVVTGY
jgi:hypothetical protein